MCQQTSAVCIRPFFFYVLYSSCACVSRVVSFSCVCVHIQESTGSWVTATMVPDASPRGPVEWLDSAVWGTTRRGGR